LELVFTDTAKDFLAQRGYDPVYGARPLKRVIANLVETDLAQKLIAGELKDGDRIVADVEGGGLAFRTDGAKARRAATG
jgi:ATP-dependent Clp protease ATP-binding subunit ClpB